MESQRTRHRPLVWMLALCLGLALGLTTACGSRNPTEGTPQSVTEGTFVDAPEAPAGATVVTVGLYAINAHSIDPSANTFFFSGYIWLRWKGDINPMDTLEFANLVEERVKKVLMSEPVELDNGEKLMQVKIQGRFFDPYDLRNYPLDQQQISIVLEDSMNTADKVVYRVDEAASGYDSTLSIPGWHLRGLSTSNLVHHYGTDFGDTSVNASDYSAARFTIRIERVRNMFLWKLLLPILLVLCTCWLALVLPPRYADARMAMPATALLTTVFLQQGSLNAIPQVSSLVLMDMIYVVAYVAIVLTFGRVIIANLRLRHDAEPESMAKVARVDHWVLAFEVAAVAAILLVMIFTRT